MIGPGTGVRVYLACGATDMRKGIDGLAAKAQEVLRQDPCSGAVFAFRGRRGDRLKLLTSQDLTALGLILRTTPTTATRRGVRSMQLRRVDGYSAAYSGLTDEPDSVSE